EIVPSGYEEIIEAISFQEWSASNYKQRYPRALSLVLYFGDTKERTRNKTDLYFLILLVLRLSKAVLFLLFAIF
ncbi:MAG: hypothetical protein ABI207_09200, partial [Crocinitomicaceae bacterium]